MNTVCDTSLHTMKKTDRFTGFGLNGKYIFGAVMNETIKMVVVEAAHATHHRPKDTETGI